MGTTFRTDALVELATTARGRLSILLFDLVLLLVKPKLCFHLTSSKGCFLCTPPPSKNMWRTRLKNFGTRVLAMLNLQVVPKSSSSPAAVSASRAPGTRPLSGGLHFLDEIAIERPLSLAEAIKRRLEGENLPLVREDGVPYLKFNGFDLYIEGNCVVAVGYRYQGRLLFARRLHDDARIHMDCTFCLNFGPDVAGRVQLMENTHYEGIPDRDL